MTVQLDKSKTGTAIPLAEAEFDMTDFQYGTYKYRNLKLIKCPGNDFLDFDENSTYLEIGLKGTKHDGLV